MGILDIASVEARLQSYIYSEQRVAFTFPEETYDNWTFLASVEGKFKYEVNSQKGEARVGELVLCPPGVTLYRQALNKLSFHFAIFELHTFNKHFEEIDFPFSGKLTWRNAAQLLQTLENMKTSRSSISRKYTEHLLNDLLYQMIKENSAACKDGLPTDPCIREAVRYINEYACKEISLQLIARHVGLSQSQFTRKFQKQMGMAPNKYVTDIRLQKVRKLLTETDDTLDQIAVQCGYQNAFYLSRVFTKTMEMNPSHYRRTHQV